MNGKVIVITGGSSGIGAALAKVVAAKGAKAVICARREAELHAVAKETGAWPIVADVTKRADVQRVLQLAIEKHGQVDVWVNNAGRGISKSVLELTDSDLDEMITVNVKSALYGMQAAVAHFQTRKAGHLINVSSLLGRIPAAAVRSSYSASKHFLNSLTANLRMDLVGTGIHVSLVTPGVVATDFGKNALHGGIDSRQLPNAQPVEEVAQVIADVIEKPRADVYTRPEYQQYVVNYFSAEDLAAFERQLVSRR